MTFKSLILPCILFVSILLEAQTTSDKSNQEKWTIEKNAIYNLKNGGALLVRLVSDSKKISELDKRVAANPNDTKTKERLRRVRAERQSFNREWVDALKDNYTFSDIYFLYDYDTKRLIRGESSGFFLDEDLHVDPSIEIEQNFLILGEGGAGESGVSAFIVMDENARPLSRPFPYYFKKNDFWKVLFSIFDSQSPRYRNLDKIAQEINDSFNAFYDKSFD